MVGSRAMGAKDDEGAKSRRGRGTDAVYFDHTKGTECRDTRYHRYCSGRWRGEVSLGFHADGRRNRRKVSGKTKTAVTDRLAELRREIDQGLQTSRSYTTRQVVEDWLRNGLGDVSARTRSVYREATERLLRHIGARPLRDLTADDERKRLDKMKGEVSTRYMQIARNSLSRAIKHSKNRVARNVADDVVTPKGMVGRPSRSFTLEQSRALLRFADGTPLYAYVVLSLLVGVRTEEARALRWDQVDLDGDADSDPSVPPHLFVMRAVRAGGDTKTRKSRRALELPKIAVEALKEHLERQARDRRIAGGKWQETGLVFCSQAGTGLDAANVRRQFRKITKGAGLGQGWAPRDMRHSFVSILSEDGVPIEEIARLVGHNRTATTETVYRHELRPVIQSGAEVMNRLFRTG